MNLWRDRENDDTDSDEEDRQFLLKMKAANQSSTVARANLNPGDITEGNWHVDEDIVHEIWPDRESLQHRIEPEISYIDIAKIAFGYKWEKYENVKDIDLELWEKVWKSRKFIHEHFCPDRSRFALTKRDMLVELFDSNEEWVIKSQIKEKLAAMLKVGVMVESFNAIMMYKTTIEHIRIGFDLNSVKGPDDFEDFFKYNKKYL